MPSVRLLLASTSRYRAELLQRTGVEFDTAAPRFDESTLNAAFDSTPDEAFALRLARAKADSLADRYPGHVILAADQIATVNQPQRSLLHKPGTEARAVEQLMGLAGRTHTLTCGVVMLEPATGRVATAVDQQRLTMRSFAESEAQAYVERYRPIDCVGAYRIEDAGITLFDRVEADDITSIIGLPLLHTCRLLREFGLLPA